MSHSVDKCKLSGPYKTWRIERYIGTGFCVMQHVKSGRAHSGVVDDFGSIVWPGNDTHVWRMGTDEVVPFYPIN